MLMHFIPGQVSGLHNCVSDDSPAHELPSPTGEGLVHVRVLVKLPPPQVTVQVSLVHELQPPSTANSHPLHTAI